jgi:thiol-disulfide isomerase/thioredoxin
MKVRVSRSLKCLRPLYLGLVVVISGAASAGDPEGRVDYDLFAAVTPIGESAADLRPASGEILLLQFWASWCQSCGTIMWDMDELVRQNPGLKYVAVSLDDEIDKARNYIRKHSLYEKYSGQYFYDSDKQFSRSIGVETVPAILLVDENGKLLVQKFGHLNSTDLQEFVVAIQAAP